MILDAQTPVLWLAVGLVTTTILLHLSRTWWTLRHIPGPFLSSITNLQRVWWVKTKQAHLHHQAVHAQYGDVVRIGPRMVSIANPEAIPTVYPIRPGIPKGDFYAALRPYSKERGSMLLVFNTTDEAMHKRMKSPIASLFSLSNVIAFEGLVDEVLDVFSRQIEIRFVGTEEIFDLSRWLQFFAFDVMGTMSFSKRYGFLEAGRDKNMLLDALSGFFDTAAPMTQITWLDRWLYKNQFVHRFRNTPGMVILDFVHDAICERKRDIETGKEAPSRDFLARFLEIHGQNNALPSWCSTAWTVSNVIAGSETTGSVMQTVMCLKLNNNLLTHPTTLQKLQRELFSANLSQPYPKWKEVRDLPYLDACVQEATRIHPPFALPLERIVPAGGITVQGHYLPEGTLVGGNPFVVNRHKPTFGADAEEWRPERWLCTGDERKRLDQGLLTFGAGRRVCLGKWIGLFEVKKLIPFLVLNYEIENVDPKALEVENSFFVKQRGFKCRIKKCVAPTDKQ